ncbi:hypothetical protein [Oleiharenicola lentus]|uniref:hypothetical protein n=1 Tax=Oleiharenicola lentus TaxID=2508720 RepID=UPI003F661FA0
MRRSIAIPSVLVSVVTRAWAADLSWDFSHDEDVRTLIETKRVVVDSSLFFHGIPKPEIALGRILKRDDYVRPLTCAYNKGTPATKAYC